MTRSTSSYLPGLIGPDTILVDGEEIALRRNSINFPGATQTDNPDEDRTDITLSAGDAPTVAGTDGQIQKNDGAGNLAAISHGAVGSVLRQTSATAAAFGQLDLADTDAVTGALPSSKGGTGQDFSASSGLVKLTAGTASAVAAPSGAVVGTTDAQALSNKTIDSASNTVTLAASTITSGTLVHERGGLEADVSAYSGLVKITGGATSAVAAPNGDVVGTSDSQALTNKTINAASNTVTNVSLTAGVTGTLPIANGGTAQTSVPGSSGEVLINSSSAYGAATNVKAGSGFVSIGSGTVASEAGLRFNSSSQALLAVRNAGDTNNLVALAFNGSTGLMLGTDTSYTSAKQYATVEIYSSTSGGIYLGRGSSIGALLDSGGLRLAVALGGLASSSTPLTLKATLVTQIGTGDTTLVGAQYECPFIDVTGAPGGNFNIIGPTNLDAIFIVTNGTANTCTFKKSGGTGVAIGAGKTAIVRRAVTDYVRITADV